MITYPPISRLLRSLTLNRSSPLTPVHLYLSKTSPLAAQRSPRKPLKPLPPQTSFSPFPLRLPMPQPCWPSYAFGQEDPGSSLIVGQRSHNKNTASGAAAPAIRRVLGRARSPARGARGRARVTAGSSKAAATAY